VNRHRILALVGFGLASVGLWVVQASAQTTPPPVVSVGISVDSRDGLTETSINCGKDGSFSTVDGDGTLFMENRTPRRMICSITIRRG
jgi:hypothetical protein